MGGGGCCGGPLCDREGRGEGSLLWGLTWSPSLSPDSSSVLSPLPFSISTDPWSSQPQAWVQSTTYTFTDDSHLHLCHPSSPKLQIRRSNCPFHVSTWMSTGIANSARYKLSSCSSWSPPHLSWSILPIAWAKNLGSILGPLFHSPFKPNLWGNPVGFIFKICMESDFKIWHKWTYLRNKNRFTDIDNRHGCQWRGWRRDGLGVWD